MHWRGRSGTPNRPPPGQPLRGHARTDECAHSLRGQLGKVPSAVVGYSLGGNLLLKYLGECRPPIPLRAVVAISVPFELCDAMTRLERGFFRLYTGRSLTTYPPCSRWTSPGCASSSRSTIRCPPPRLRQGQGLLQPLRLQAVSGWIQRPLADPARSLRSLHVPHTLPVSKSSTLFYHPGDLRSQRACGLRGEGNTDVTRCSSMSSRQGGF